MVEGGALRRGRGHPSVDRLPRTLSADDLERFWSFVDQSAQCWLWIGYCDDDGYGRFGIGGQVALAHRLSYVLAGNTLAPGDRVLHSCDTPACVRPDHLWSGTQRANIEDCIRKGRRARQSGDRNGRAVLTWALVTDIRSLGESLPQGKIAIRYGVSRTLVGAILRNEIWRPDYDWQCTCQEDLPKPQVVAFGWQRAEEEANG